MNSQEIQLLKKLQSGLLGEKELVEIYNLNRNNYRVGLNLVMHPRIPENIALGLISSIFPLDLVRVSKNKRSHPAIRRRAENEFRNRYNKLSLGVKITCMKIAANSLLLNFINEDNQKVLTEIVDNPNCSDELIIRMINRNRNKQVLYNVLADSEKIIRPMISEAILNDSETPIKVLLRILPILNSTRLKKLYQNERIHSRIKQNILAELKKRKSK